ncbi:hypothetical protein AKJ16_DCAP25057, partial [Drosera capensis]
MPWKSISRMVLIYVILNRFSSSLAILNSQDPKTGWLFKFLATVVAGVAVVAYVWRHTWTRINPSQDVGTSQDTDHDPELICSCGLRARLREGINYLRSRWEHDRVVWETEKSDLTSKLSAVQAELDDIKSRIQQVIESDAMPPFDDSCMVDDEPDGAVVIGTRPFGGQCSPGRNLNEECRQFLEQVSHFLPNFKSQASEATVAQSCALLRKMYILQLHNALVLSCMTPHQQPCLGALWRRHLVVDSV